MTYPIRLPPDGDTAWGNDVRTTISGVNDHQARLTALESPLASTVQTASYTFVAGDFAVPERELVYNSASAGTFTVPSDASASVAIGLSVVLHQFGTGQLTVAPASGVTLVARGSAFKLAGQYGIAGLRKYGANSWILYGDITT